MKLELLKARLKYLWFCLFFILIFKNLSGVSDGQPGYKATGWTNHDSPPSAELDI